PLLLNQQLGCARAITLRKALIDGGIPASRIITPVTGHGPTAGPAADRQGASITIIAAPTPTPTPVTRHHFRLASVSFLACAPCNPFTDDGSFALAPPATEAAASSFRMLHFVEAEVASADGIHIHSSTPGLVGSNHIVGHSGFC